MKIPTNYCITQKQTCQWSECFTKQLRYFALYKGKYAGALKQTGAGILPAPHIDDFR